MRFRDGLVVALFCFVSSAQSREPVSVGGWTIEEDIGRVDFTPMVRGARNTKGQVRPAPRDGTRVAYLILQNDGSWLPAADADASEPGIEAVWLRKSDRTIGLAVMGTDLTTKGDQQSICNRRHTADRAKSGYSLCNSDLVSEIHDMGVLLTPLFVLTGKIGAYRVDSEKLAQALSGVDIDAFYDAVNRPIVEAEAREAANNAEAARQAALRREQRLEDLKPWQSNLQPGDRTICGMVVDVRPAVISIQTPQNGLKWIRRDAARPIGMSNDAMEIAVYCGSL
ncbi:MAG: hypothetical protein EPN60_04360 [Nevskiaceae bacterium]|nr:MAG: hypothetical protein EPO48_12160 [Nevskiaceae bacterium]TAM31412.1 MAG: hypothetical protein EPN60_04360 [Nevskiaceae bacterium]